MSRYACQYVALCARGSKDGPPPVPIYRQPPSITGRRGKAGKATDAGAAVRVSSVRAAPLSGGGADGLAAGRTPGMVVLPTGSGKTRLALGAIAATQTPALCLAPTRALCDQWAAALAAVWDGPIGRFGDGERMTGAVTIATYAGAYRHMSSLGDKFGLLIVDEAHHFGQGWRDEALEMSIAPLRLGLTATPPDPGPAADRLAALIGPVVFERSIGIWLDATWRRWSG